MIREIIWYENKLVITYNYHENAIPERPTKSHIEDIEKQIKEASQSAFSFTMGSHKFQHSVPKPSVIRRLFYSPPKNTPPKMLSAGTPDITPQNMRFAGTPEYLYGIVKAPDKVMAETHKKMHFADARGMRLRAETHKKRTSPTY